jgi:hypothetical protein
MGVKTLPSAIGAQDHETGLICPECGGALVVRAEGGAVSVRLSRSTGSVREVIERHRRLDLGADEAPDERPG